mgnify:CR=1 FL=1
MTTPILEARDLSKLFPGPKKLFTPARFVTAVDRVSLAVMPGETLAIVGESGSGKSTLGRLLLRLLAASEGRVFYQGEEITDASGARLNQLRRELQIIFQDPFASLNPRQRIGTVLLLAAVLLGLDDDHAVLRDAAVAQRQQALEAQLPQALQRSVAQNAERLERAALRLELLDPRLVLQRGYALLTDTSGQAVTSIRQAQPGDALRATLSDGAVDVTVSQPRLL